MSNLIRSLNKFGFEVLQVLNAENNEQNIIFSPYSVFVSTAIITDIFMDETKNEILKVLQVDEKDLQKKLISKKIRKLVGKEKSNELTLFSAIYASKSLNIDHNDFEQNIRELEVTFEKIEFSQTACNEINEKANNSTGGMIQVLVDPLDFKSDSSIILLNATYFKCDWDKKFIIDLESNQPEINSFTLIDGTKIHITMMETFDRILPYAENDKFQVVSIPYLNDQYDFVLILPKNETKAGYDDLLKLTFERLKNDLLKKAILQKVDIKLPKFSLECKFQLNDILQSFGMKKAFSEIAECADSNSSYHISSIIQKTKIDIDEKGIDPKAIPLTMNLKCSCCFFQPRAPKIIANHPFAFMITNTKTGSILLEGIVKNPSI
ncbi:hypothetical protein M9Y10_024993 [Tritrichomonas musculus]|uniref:Serpin domain-containing protein n=1 Tax=Tritrichomonas musculus TaxID=1915356 RepID=A0ABR2HD00_9EUKA